MNSEKKLSEEQFSQIMDGLVEECEDVLRRFLPDPDHMPSGEEPAATVASAMRYSTMAGGKRLRPLLIARISDLYGGDRQLAEPFMAALEMIHTYSLVHDDLPAMDDDDYRRGRKTTHIVYGEGMAVLAGDGLLNFAYETAAAAFDAAGTPEQTQAVVRALRVLMRNAGIYGMVGGQCADLEAENSGTAVTPQLLEYIHSHKTACMIQSGFMIGAILADASNEDVRLSGEIARKIGVAFQIRDDILDVTADAETLGKPSFSDEKNNKTTFVSLHGIEAAERRVQELTDEAIHLMQRLTGENRFLTQLFLSLVGREK